MPYFETEMQIDPEEFLDKCDDDEKEELRNLLGNEGLTVEEDIYKHISTMFFRNELDLKKLVNEIGRENFVKVLYN